MKPMVWIFASLALATPAFAQDPPKRPVDQRAMYEDIEVMRAILSRRMMPNCTSCHENAKSGVSFMAAGMSGMSPVGSGSGGLAGMMGPINSATDPIDAVGIALNERNFDTFLANHPHAGITMPSLEGAYLKGQGVLFQATMPSVPLSELAAGGPAQSPKSLSDWEKTRLQIRGEQPKPAGATGRMTLANELLKTIAENGKNFSHLPENESLTLIITFRTAAPASGGGAGMPAPGMMSGGMAAPGMGSMGGGGGGIVSPMGGLGGPPAGPMGGAPMPGAGGSPLPPPGVGGGESMTPDRELELLGDLHQKRGNWNDAASAYERARQKAADPGRVRDLAKKLVEVYLKTGDLEKAHKVLGNAVGDVPKVNVQSKVTEAPVKPAINLPTRLIISAPKRLLDQVGDGKMSFAEFQKLAALEVLRFDGPPAPKK